MNEAATKHAEEAAPETTSEAEALADIVLWSKDCPAWQRDALRRLCSKDRLNEEDSERLLILCKGEATDAEPLTADHVRDPGAAAANVSLRGIHDVAHVNALAQGERLTFDKTGVTVVYGDNGSGKSGYARILKQVCRARLPKDDKVLPNIYAARTGSPAAAIDFTAGGQNKSAAWTSGQAADPLLSSVSVFDSRTANVHVDQTNDVAYTPLPMKILEQLAHACQELKKRLGAEVRALEDQTPASIRNPECHARTAVGKLIAGLGAQTKPEDVEALATLSPVETKRFDELRADFSRDPAKVARQLQALQSRLEKHVEGLSGLAEAITDERREQLRRLFQQWDTARRAAAAAAGDLFADEPLPDVGSETWRALWEAARAYSQQHAYREAPFPFTDDGARCVLCQQELDVAAAERMVRFERFVRNETRRKEAETEAAYQAAVDELAGAGIPIADLRGLTALIADDLGDDVLGAQVRRAALTAKWRLRAIVRRHASDDALPAGDAFPTEAIGVHAVALGTRAKALLGEEESEERKRMQADYEELSDRAWLAIVKDDVLAEIGRRQKIAALNAVAKDTVTNRITAKSTEIAEHLVTNALRAQFSREIDRLGVAGLAIELRKDKTAYGVPHFRVSLIRKPDARVGDVLSEGEHRCVALAAFLAELATTDGESAIVFDDPVSSLDHMHREAVAERLADEGKARQIIVFTHDIAFLFLLDQSCRDKGTHIAFRCVTRSRDFAGFCQQDPPARAQPIEQVIEGMQKQLDNEKVRYERGDQEAWERTLDSLEKRLRWTWERAVEDSVAPVIKRLSNKVQTAGLGKVTTITMDDCLFMREAYGRCSKLLHSSSEALNAPLPGPDVVQKEIDALRDWVADIKGRQEKIDWLQ